MNIVPGRSVIAHAPDAYPDYPGQDSFGLQEMWRVLLRRRAIVAAVFGLTVLLGAAYALLRPPVYEATAVLMMRPNEPQATVTDSQQRSAQPDNGYVQSQVELLRSPALARQVGDRLGLAGSGWTLGGERARRRAARQRVANAIGVARREGTYIVEVKSRDRDPEVAARIANDLIGVYFASREQARLEYASETSDWLSDRLAQLRHEVQMREAEVERYRAENGLLTIDGSMLAEQQLRDAEASLVAARAELAERNARHRQVLTMVNRGGSAETTAGALNSETMSQLRARQADVARRLADYAQRYEERHPALQAARAEQADIARQIEAESARVAQNLDNEAEIASARVATLQSHLSAMRSQLAGDNAQQVRLRELERNAQAARAVYENFLRRYHEVSRGGLGGDAQVVASAVPPGEPVSRSIAFMLALSAALGLAAGALAAFLAEQFSTTLQTADEVERKTGAPILTSIPRLSRSDLTQLPVAEQHPAAFILTKPMSAFAEAMRMLRARIAHAAYADGVKVVLVTSALAGEGKSSTALSLARVVALAGRKVMLIDCDLRRRSLNHLLCIEPRLGITHVLRGQANWRDVTGRDELSGAHVLPAPLEDFTGEDLFNSDSMRTLLRELSETYELVLIDCAPVLTLADVRDLGAAADGVVLVARRNQTNVMALQTAIAELKAVNAQILGVAFNAADPRAPGRLSYADPLYFAHAQSNAYVT